MLNLPLTVLLALLGSVGFVAVGQAVTGTPQTIAPLAIPGQIGVVAPEANVQLAQADDPALMAALMTEGERAYSQNCSACHGAQGQGVAGPSLIGSEFLASVSAVATQILAGTDPGHDYMPAFAAVLNDRQIASIGTFIRNSWGNAFGIVTEPEVAATRLAVGPGGGD
jgi:mono/diheme cytochrome c family protein